MKSGGMSHKHIKLGASKIMSYNIDSMVNDVLSFGAKNAAIIDPGNIKGVPALREMCALNSCGKYGTNWMCPPATGPIDELTKKIKLYKHGLVFQTVYQLEDSFDFEGMMDAKAIHQKVFDKVLTAFKDKYRLNDFLPLGAGACEICAECTYKNGEKCRFPDKAIASMEAYGIDVTALVTSCGIPYNNGESTVSYVGLVLFN